MSEPRPTRAPERYASPPQRCDRCGQRHDLPSCLACAEDLPEYPPLGHWLRGVSRTIALAILALYAVDLVGIVALAAGWVRS